MIYWTKEMNKALREYRAQGFSFSVIGDMMGVSRNAVAGRCHRLNLCHKGGPSPVVRKTKATTKAPPPEPEVEPEVEPVIEPVSRVRGAVASILAASWMSCRYPIGDPRHEDFQFCGRSTEVGKPYCADHCKISYIKPMRS
jgi:GcrA cell cycle regulator